MSKALHRFAVFVAGATFFLIIAGANVTSRDAGLATSDWPLSEGQVFPKMVGNLFWEHGHRLIAASVGLLTIALAIFLQVKERRTWVKCVGWFALVLVIVQGLIGGLTVKLNLPVAVSSAHSTLAQLFFLTTISLAVFTSRSWMEAPEPLTEQKSGVSLRTLSVVTLVLILAQLVLGATMRHSAEWYEWLPTSLLLAHIAGAVIVTLALSLTAMTVFLRHREAKFLTRPAAIALGLLFVQLMLGLASYVVRARSPFDVQPLNPMIAVTVSHVACGALVFAATIVLTLRVFRVLRTERQAREVGVLAPA